MEFRVADALYSVGLRRFQALSCRRPVSTIQVHSVFIFSHLKRLSLLQHMSSFEFDRTFRTLHLMSNCCPRACASSSRARSHRYSERNARSVCRHAAPVALPTEYKRTGNSVLHSFLFFEQHSQTPLDLPHRHRLKGEPCTLLCSCAHTLNAQLVPFRFFSVLCCCQQCSVTQSVC